MSTEDMMLEFSEAVTNAYMTNRPLVVTEGKDDLSYYKNLAKHYNLEIEIRPIQYFKNRAPGCNSVEDALEEIEAHYGLSGFPIKSVLGILDKDTKDLTHDIKDTLGLYYLERYSFESLFVTKETIFESLKLLTNISEIDYSEALKNHICEEINRQLPTFSLASLEALKNACITEYDGEIGFSDSYEKATKNPVIKDALKQKQDDLIIFAEEQSIIHDDIFMLSVFTKGKWCLKFFINEIISASRNLKNLCGVDLDKCDFYHVDNHNTCCYMPRTPHLNSAQLAVTIIGNCLNSDHTELIERLSELKA